MFKYKGVRIRRFHRDIVLLYLSLRECQEVCVNGNPFPL